jgi:hypothetical protein
MTAEVSIVAGIGIVSSLFAYYAFEFRNSEEQVVKQLSVLMFFFSILFANLLIYAMYMISVNSLVYLQNSVLEAALAIITYFTVAMVIIYAIVMLLMFLKSLLDYIKGLYRGSG